MKHEIPEISKLVRTNFFFIDEENSALSFTNQVIFLKGCFRIDCGFLDHAN